MERRHPTFPTRYYVGLVPDDPLTMPTSELTIRSMRHTCVTQNHDAGVPPELIRGITGHTDSEINDILKHYRARTADQAAAALEMRSSGARVPRLETQDSDVGLSFASVLVCGFRAKARKRWPACILWLVPRSDSNQHFREET